MFIYNDRQDFFIASANHRGINNFKENWSLAK